MNRTGWIALVAACAVGAFGGGFILGRARRPEERHGPPSTQVTLPQTKSASGRNVNARRRTYREALAEALLNSAPLPDASEDDTQDEATADNDLAERSRAIFQKARTLRNKIVQRNDGVLREAGLAELATLIESNDSDDLLLGLTSLFHLDEMNIGADRFRPQIVAAIGSAYPEVRNAALNCLPMVCPPEEALVIALGMASDDSADVRASAAFNLTFMATRERVQDIQPVLAALLQDTDEAVRKKALVALWKTCGLCEPEEQAARIEGLTKTISADPQRAGEVLGWWENRMKFRQEDVQRFAEILSEEGPSLFGGESYSERTLMGLFDVPFVSGDVQPVVTQLCLRVLTDSTDDALRRRALEVVPDLRNNSLVSALEELAETPRAAGIEAELKQTIERLSTGPPLPSLKGRGGQREESVETGEVAAEPAEATPEPQQPPPDETE